MDDDKFMEWFNNNYDTNAVKYAEKNEDDFCDYCIDLYNQAPDEDEIYERYKNDAI